MSTNHNLLKIKGAEVESSLSAFQHNAKPTLCDDCYQVSAFMLRTALSVDFIFFSFNFRFPPISTQILSLLMIDTSFLPLCSEMHYLWIFLYEGIQMSSALRIYFL